MNYAAIIQDLPQELQMTMLKLVEAVEQQLRDQLGIRHEDFDGLKAVVQTLAEAQKLTEQRLEELIQAQQRTEQAIIQLAGNQSRMQTRQDQLVGYLLERQYRDKAYAYFGRIMRRVKVVSFQELEESLENLLPDYERNDLLLLDLLVRGQPRTQPDAPEVWLAVEISAVVDRNDVERAQRRAAILKRVGYPIIPAAAGEQATLGGEDAAHTGKVLLVRNGNIQFWEEALAETLSGS